MKKPLNKAFEIRNAKISFVSLVDKAANKRTFLIVKQEGNTAKFQTNGRILKAEPGSHYVTGIVYEPSVEDTDGNFMTEEEITKAAHWFMKNGNKIDLQHSFEPMKDARVVESWVAKTDTTIEGQPVKKGTWLMTVEVNNGPVWKAIEKGEITGFSMGGVGDYSSEDVQLEKADKPSFQETFLARMKEQGIWAATDCLMDSLRKIDPFSGGAVFTSDESYIRENLEAFNKALTGLLAGDQPLFKSISQGTAVLKAGRAMSIKNLETLRTIRQSIDEFIKVFEPTVEDDSQQPASQQPVGQQEPLAQPASPGTAPSPETPQEGTAQQKPAEATEEPQSAPDAQPALQPSPEDEEDGEDAADRSRRTSKSKKGETSMSESAKTPTIDETFVEQAVDKAIKKALDVSQKAPAAPEAQPTAEQIESMIEKAVQKAMDPILKARGNPTNLNDSGKQPDKPQEQHYLHGLL